MKKLMTILALFALTNAFGQIEIGVQSIGGVVDTTPVVWMDSQSSIKKTTLADACSGYIHVIDSLQSIIDDYELLMRKETTLEYVGPVSGVKTGTVTDIEYDNGLIVYEMDSIIGNLTGYVYGEFGGHRFISDDGTITAYSKIGVRTIGVMAMLFRTRDGKYFMAF